MANSEAGTSSDVARTLGGEYQVFLSYRGPDTRHGFTDFLYHGLVDAGIRVFKDEDELRFGEVIGGSLLRAINNSIIYIPIFSRNYASSKWCLRELAHIVDNMSKSEGKKSVFPIFFDVEPEDVKLKTPRYSDALLEHENKFPDEVKVWRKALAEVDEIKGWNVKKDQSQAKLVESVVRKVLEKLETRQKLLPRNLVGLDDRIRNLTELIDVNHRDVRLIAIYGMGGIGKTTVAMVVFNRLSSHFGKCCSFLDDVQENSATKEGIVKLQNKLLSDIAGSRSAGMEDSEHGMRRIGDTFSAKKVLVVLDDIDNKDHIEKLIGNSSLHSGSRIIITTRNIAVLQVEGFKGEILRYEMLKMDDGSALQLFYRHAFGGGFPSDDYRRLSSEIVSSMGGLPLAIELIGSLLKEKNSEIWEETMEKLKKVPEKKILEKLRISYDDLDKHHKQIFLDIACFFSNKNKTEAMYMWTDCQFYPKEGIEVLTNRCLVKILDDDKFWMHDQLIALGRQIVLEESQDDLGKQSRLWIAKEAFQIIRTEERLDKVQALKLNGKDGFIYITNEDLERLPNLRYLNVRNANFVGDFLKCRSKLRWISWEPLYPYDRVDNMFLDHLVVFELHMNDFTDDSKAWDLIKRAQNLKVLSLFCCVGIRTIPDFSKCLGLERLTLIRCSKLERIESFIGELQSLIELEIDGCMDLTDLPEEMGALVKLKRFSLRRCPRLRGLPSSLGNLTSLIELDLSGTRISKLPNSIGNLKSLRALCLSNIGSSPSEHPVWYLPSNISMLVKLEVLDLSGREELRGEIPIGIGELSSLRVLDLKYTGISGIPRTIDRLRHLQTLNLMGCHSIQVLPDLPTSLTHLILESRSLLLVPNLSNLTNLVELQLHDGSWFTKKSIILKECNLSWIGRLSRLKKLILNLQNVPAPPELASLPCLEELDLRLLDPKLLMQLPSSDWSWRNLSTLVIGWCEVEDIPLEGFTRLEKLTINRCQQLQRLSIPWELRKLREVCVYGCPELVEIQVVGLSKSLECLSVHECESLTRICGLSYLKNLAKLRIYGCAILTNLEGLDELESLKSLEVTSCKELTWLIDASCTNIPDDCVIRINKCGDSTKDCEAPYDIGMSLKRYREEILSNVSNKV